MEECRGWQTRRKPECDFPRPRRVHGRDVAQAAREQPVPEPADELSVCALLAGVCGHGRGFELVSNVNRIPKGSRLAVSTNLLGALIGAVLALGISAILGRFDRRVRSREHAEQVSGLRARVSVPMATGTPLA